MLITVNPKFSLIFLIIGCSTHAILPDKLRNGGKVDNTICSVFTKDHRKWLLLKTSCYWKFLSCFEDIKGGIGNASSDRSKFNATEQKRFSFPVIYPPCLILVLLHYLDQVSVGHETFDLPVFLIPLRAEIPSSRYTAGTEISNNRTRIN